MRLKLLIIITIIFTAASLQAQDSMNVQQIISKRAGNNVGVALYKYVYLKYGAIISVPKEYSQKNIGTIDSDRGELTSQTQKIIYDIGFSAGSHMGGHRKAECSSYVDTLMNGHRIYIGLRKTALVYEIIATVRDEKLMDYHAFPANFWSYVTTEEEIREFLKIVFSYKPKTKDK